MKLVHLKNNKVINISLPPVGYVAATDEKLVADNAVVGIGWDYNPGSDSYSAPTTAGMQSRKITLGAFQKRLGAMNVFAIDTSSNELCVALRSYLNRFSFIDLDDPDLPSLLGMMQAANQPAANAAFPGSGPITSALITKVLTDPVVDGERP